jgi:alpha-1,3-rhamnosyl/mannosyltransferase
MVESKPNITVRKAVPHRNMLGDALFGITKFLSCILWQLSSRNLDIVHLTDPFGSVVLSRKLVATVNDIFPITRDEFRGTELRRLYWKRTADILEKARAVITPSDYVRKSLREYSPESCCPVTSIPDAASDEFHPRIRNMDILNKYRLGNRPYFLFVGRVDSRKNIPGLMKAYLELPCEVRSKTDLTLVLSGYPHDINSFRSEYTSLLEGKGIVYLRDVPSEDLQHLYSSALAFVFPTLDEGFGLPVLEAMQSGCPVISSNLSCIPEIADDAAVLVDPRNTSELGESMRLMAESPGKRSEFRRRGLERAEIYSWKRAARETMEIYRSAVQ